MNHLQMLDLAIGKWGCPESWGYIVEITRVYGRYIELVTMVCKVYKQTIAALTDITHAHTHTHIYISIYTQHPGLVNKCIYIHTCVHVKSCTPKTGLLDTSNNEHNDQFSGCFWYIFDPSPGIWCQFLSMISQNREDHLGAQDWLVAGVIFIARNKVIM